MLDKEKKVCPSCGAEAEFIITCADCGYAYCPWCLIRLMDTNRVFIPSSFTSCPKCGSDKHNIGSS